MNHEQLKASDDGLDILWLNVESCNAAVIFERNGQDWLVIEDATYGPMRYDDVQRLFPLVHEPDYDDVYPFMTTGTRTVVQIETGRMHRYQFEATEGFIQGLVYALIELADSSGDNSERYRHYITENLIPSDFEERAAVNGQELTRIYEQLDRRVF